MRIPSKGIRNRLFKTIAFLMVCLIPFGVWHYFAFPSKAQVVSKLPWRELVVFIMPFIYLYVYNIPIRKWLINLVILFVVLISVPVVITFLYTDQSFYSIGIGLLPYISSLFLFMFFHSLKDEEVDIVVRFVKYSMIIGGIGLAFDFFSGYAISLRIEEAGFSRVSQQISLVPRASFLYTGIAQGATILSVMIYTVIVYELINYEKSSNWLTLFSIIFASFGMIFTFSRVGFLAIILLVPAFFLINYKANKKIIFTTLVVIFAVFSISHKVLNTDSKVYLDKRFNSLLLKDTGENLNQGRVEDIREGLNDIANDLLVGRGIGSGNPRNAGIMDVKHYENFPLWVINESGLIGFSLMFFPYFMTVFYILKSGCKIKQKLSLLYLFVVLCTIVSVNPGGATFGIIVSVCLSAIVHKRLLKRN